MNQEEKLARNFEKYKEYQKKYYRENKERINKRVSETRTVEMAMYHGAKVRAKRKGIEFSIELSDIVVPSHCPVLGIPIYKSPGRMTHNSPTLDRRDNSKGYVKGNVFVISNKANRCKSDLSIEEVISLYKYTTGE